MNAQDIVTIISEMDTQRVKLAIILTNVLTAPGIPETTETFAVKLATVASLMDFIDEYETNEHSKPLVRHIQQSIDTCLKNGSRFVPESVTREMITSMRSENKERKERVKAGDDILGGIDFSDN